MSDNQFPVHPSDRDILRFVPLDFMRQFESSAMRNHSQTLDRLAERGGLSIREIWGTVFAVSNFYKWPSKTVALEQILAEIAKFQEKP